jgi:hypothetical protein
MRRAAISARVIGWSRMMIARTQPDGLGQVKWLQHLVPALEVPEQALDEAARAARGDQLQAIVVDHDLLAPRRLRQERIDGGLQAGLCPPAGREQVVPPHRLANGKQRRRQ